MTLRKRDDTGNRKKKKYITIRGKLTWKPLLTCCTTGHMVKGHVRKSHGNAVASHKGFCACYLRIEYTRRTCVGDAAFTRRTVRYGSLSLRNIHVSERRSCLKSLVRKPHCKINNLVLQILLSPLSLTHTHTHTHTHTRGSDDFRFWTESHFKRNFKHQTGWDQSWLTNTPPYFAILQHAVLEFSNCKCGKTVSTT